MGKESLKSALPTLFHFVRVRAAFQPHVNCIQVSIVASFYVLHLNPKVNTRVHVYINQIPEIKTLKVSRYRGKFHGAIRQATPTGLLDV